MLDPDSGVEVGEAFSVAVGRALAVGEDDRAGDGDGREPLLRRQRAASAQARRGG